MLWATGGVATQRVKRNCAAGIAPALPLQTESGDRSGRKWYHSRAVLIGWVAVHLMPLA